MCIRPKIKEKDNDQKKFILEFINLLIKISITNWNI